MAYSFTVTDVKRGVGNMRWVHGTFTSAAGDNQGTLSATTHGLNYIKDYRISLDAGGVDTPIPKVSISSGTITFTFADTEGYSGTWSVLGK